MDLFSRSQSKHTVQPKLRVCGSGFWVWMQPNGLILASPAPWASLPLELPLALFHRPPHLSRALNSPWPAERSWFKSVLPGACSCIAGLMQLPASALHQKCWHTCSLQAYVWQNSADTSGLRQPKWVALDCALRNSESDAMYFRLITTVFSFLMTWIL